MSIWAHSECTKSNSPLARLICRVQVKHTEGEWPWSRLTNLLTSILDGLIRVIEHHIGGALSPSPVSHCGRPCQQLLSPSRCLSHQVNWCFPNAVQLLRAAVVPFPP